MKSHRGLALLIVLAAGAGLPHAAGAQDASSPRRTVVVAPHTSGWLGISVTVTLEADGEPGEVRITDVWEGSPAEAAGVRPGDWIVGVNGSRVSAERFRSMTQRLQPGDPMALEVVRDGRTLSLTVVAAPRPGTDVLVPRRLQEELDAVRGRLDRILAETHVEVRSDTAGSVARVGLMAPTIVVERVGGDSIRTRVITSGDTSVSTVRIRAIPEGSGYRFETSQGPEGRAVPFSVWIRTDSAGTRVVGGSAIRAPGEVRGPVAIPRTSDPQAVLPEDAPVRPLAPFLAGMNRVAGAELKELNPGLATYFQVERGLLVTNVAEGTPADAAGLRGGDVIVSANGSPVATIQELRGALGRNRTETALQVVRKGERIDLHIR